MSVHVHGYVNLIVVHMCSNIACIKLEEKNIRLVLYVPTPLYMYTDHFILNLFNSFSYETESIICVSTIFISSQPKFQANVIPSVNTTEAIIYVKNWSH